MAYRGWARCLSEATRPSEWDLKIVVVCSAFPLCDCHVSPSNERPPVKQFLRCRWRAGSPCGKCHLWAGNGERTAKRHRFPDMATTSAWRAPPLSIRPIYSAVPCCSGPTPTDLGGRHDHARRLLHLGIITCRIPEGPRGRPAGRRLPRDEILRIAYAAPISGTRHGERRFLRQNTHIIPNS